MNISIPLLALITVCLHSAVHAAELKPLLGQPDKIVIQHDFSQPEQLTQQTWKPLMGTRWKIADGVLHGIPSTPEYQASKPDHKGLEPRVNCPVTPKEVIAKFSVRFTGGSETIVVPFVEFGHHVARVKFTKDSIYMLAEHDTLKVAETTALKYEPGKWYHCLAEVKGDEFVIQFADGPTLYARHPSYALPAPSGAPGMAFAGPKDGTAELDNVTLWSIKPDPQPSWAATRETFAKFDTVQMKKKPDEIAKPMKKAKAKAKAK